MENKLIVSPSPHVKANATTASIMLNVCAAMIPACVVAVLVFGAQALSVIIIATATAVGWEYLYNVITKQRQTISDFSAAVTGMLLAFNLPAGIPLYMVVIGTFVAIIITKQWFGGIGDNFANPAIVGRIFLLSSFTSAMTTWQPANSYAPVFVDSVSGATPLAVITTTNDLLQAPPMLNMLLGIRGGCIGETGVLALIVGGCYLIYKKVISATIPLTLIGTIFFLAWLMGFNPFYMVVSGGTMLAAFFMATDYTTSPVQQNGKIIFAVGIGVITMLIRAFGNYPEGISFAILIMNILTPHINKLTLKVPFGGVTK